MAVEFTIPGKARPKQLKIARLGRFSRIVPVAYCVTWQEHCRAAALRAFDGIPPIMGPVTIRITFGLPAPKGWSKKKRARAFEGLVLPTVTPDYDNCAKIIGDSMNGIAYGDDKQITDSICTKRYWPEPGVGIRVAEIEGCESA